MAVPIVYQNFIPPAIDAGNLNTVNNVVYTVIGDGTNAPLNGANVRTNIGALAATGGTADNLTSTNPTVIGGLLTGTSIASPAITAGTMAGTAITGGTISGLTAPLPTASGGNAVDMNTTWSTQATGAITSVAGTITSANGTCRYRIVGKTVTFLLVINIVNNGTGSGGLNIASALPVAPLITASYAGREQAVNGLMASVAFTASSTTVTAQKYDNTYVGQTGAVITFGGVYESV